MFWGFRIIAGSENGLEAKVSRAFAFLQVARQVLGGSWVVASGAISRLTIVIIPMRGHITPLTTTHEPPSILSSSFLTFSALRTREVGTRRTLTITDSAETGGKLGGGGEAKPDSRVRGIDP